TVERDRLAQNAGIAPEIRDPQSVAQQRERVALLGGHEAVAELGVHVEHIEQVRRDRGGLDFARVAGARQVVTLRPDGRDAGEVLRQRAQVVEVRERHAKPHAAESGGHDLDEPIRSGVWQRLEQYGVDRAEDGRVGADAEREREHGHEREAGALGEHADGVAEVVRSEEHTSELQSLAYFVCRLLLEKKKEYFTSYAG